MSDLVWYIFQDGKQEGPFGLEQIQEMFRSKRASEQAFVFKTGWKDWKPFAESQAELGLGSATPPPPPPPPGGAAMAERRKFLPRMSISGKIIIHNEGQLSIGKGVNISPGGIFVETDQKLFKVGDTIRLTCKIEKPTLTFQASATVIRYSTQSPKGYGLKFENLSDEISNSLKKIFEAENRK